METYPMEGICGYWIDDDEEDNQGNDFIPIYLVFDSEKLEGGLNRAVEVNRKRNKLKSDIENLFGFHTYVGSVSKKCEDAETINESIPNKFKRRFDFERMKDDVDSVVFDFNVFQYKTAGEFIAEVCDAVKDNYVSDFEFNNDDVSPKDLDDLYYALVDMFGPYLHDIYNKIKSKTMKESKKVIRLTESELVDLLKKIIKEDMENEFIDDEDMDDDGDEIQDFGFDYEEEDEDDLEKIKRRSKFKPAPMEYGSSEWKKEWEKPYSPIKASDLPLDKYLKLKQLKKDI